MSVTITNDGFIPIKEITSCDAMIIRTWTKWGLTLKKATVKVNSYGFQKKSRKVNVINLSSLDKAITATAKAFEETKHINCKNTLIKMQKVRKEIESKLI